MVDIGEYFGGAFSLATCFGGVGLTACLVVLVTGVGVDCVWVALHRLRAHRRVLFTTGLPFGIIAVACLEDRIAIRSRFTHFFTFVGQAAHFPIIGILEFRLIQHFLFAVLRHLAPFRHRVVTATLNSCGTLGISIG